MLKANVVYIGVLKSVKKIDLVSCTRAHTYTHTHTCILKNLKTLP